MTFMIILLIVSIVLVVLSVVWMVIDEGFLPLILGFIGLLMLMTVPLGLLKYTLNAKRNKALMQAHLENPTSYTYSQLAEHNELVTELKVWHGTIFSFYNDVDLQTIDIDSVSQKVIVKEENKK